MKEENKVYITTICARLERAIHADVGMKGLTILMYGWAKKKNFNLNALLYMREKRNGEPYLTLNEAKELSAYAGYDLTKD